MIRTIIFDIGNVLADFNWRSYLDEFNLPEDVEQIITNVLFQSPKWSEFDRGALSDEEILASICEDAPEQSELIRTIYSRAGYAVVQNSYAPGLVKNLKDMGYQIYILSNYGKTILDQRMPDFEFFQYVDGAVISYEVHAIKPEPAIYEALLKKYEIDPEEALFFDDRTENLEGARAFGIHTIHVTDYESIIEGLRCHGIETE